MRFFSAARLRMTLLRAEAVLQLATSTGYSNWLFAVGARGPRLVDFRLTLRIVEILALAVFLDSRDPHAAFEAREVAAQSLASLGERIESHDFVFLLLRGVGSLLLALL